MDRVFQVHIAVFPVGREEADRVLKAVRDAWVGPHWQRRVQRQGAWFVEAIAEAPLPGEETPDRFIERLSVAIWRRLGRYVRVSFELSHEHCNHPTLRALQLPEYAKLIRLH